jgi:hypothetical protein
VVKELGWLLAWMDWDLPEAKLHALQRNPGLFSPIKGRGLQRAEERGPPLLPLAGHARRGEMTFGGAWCVVFV